MNKTSVVPSDSTTPIKANRVYCLYRVSTGQQVDHNEKDEADIPMQRKECHKFAERMGWDIIHEEKEEGVSGHKVRAANRDKLQLIKEHARQGKFDIFLVFMFDRIGRIADETPFVVEWFSKNGIHVWSAKEGEQRFESHTDKLTNYIRFWQADGESEKTSIRTSTRMGQIVEDGHFTGGACPFGYRLEKRGRVNKKGQALSDLVIDEEEAPIIRLIFEKYINEGRGPQSLANWLNNQGIKNGSGQNWHPSTIRGIVKNITYLGILRSAESRSEVLPELQIIDQETFQSAQEITNQRSRHYEGIRQIPLNVRGQSLLAGNVFCGHCGARLSLTTNGKGRPRSDGTDALRIRYVCQTKTRKHEPCGGQTGYTLHKLDGMIDDMIHEIFAKVTSFSRSEVLSTSHGVQMNERKAIARKSQRDYLKAEKDLQGLKLEVIKAVNGNSAFPPDLLNNLLQETTQRCEELKQVFEAAQKDTDDGEVVMQKFRSKYDQLISWSHVYDKANMETRKMIVAQLIERVDVFRDYQLKVKFSISVEQFLVGLDISA